MMYDAIQMFHKQFAFEPKIEGGSVKRHSRFVVAGMGGSSLAAGLIKAWNPNISLVLHRDYGLPSLSEKELKESLIIVSSYSGNTEEALDALAAAGAKKLSRVAITVGGKLLDLAQKEKIPYIKLPDFGIQPRVALGLSFMAILKAIGEEDALKEISKLKDSFHATQFEDDGKNLAKKLKGFIPIIYSSELNSPIAYNFKITLNETGKIPAFCNTFPELNHNEMTGFDIQQGTRELSKNFFFLFLKDEADPLKIQKRMEVLQKLYRERGFPVEIVKLYGENVFLKIFSSIVLSWWAGYYTAKEYGVSPEEVPMVEEFKRLIAG